MNQKFVRLLILCISLAFLISASYAADEQRIDNIPMYGQPKILRPDLLKKADEDFIKEVSEKFGDREKASRIWYAQAEKFISEGNLDLAMRRYNQSWLLNPKNFQPYWGFGRILLEKRNIDEGIQFLEKSKELIDDQYQKAALLTDLGTAYSVKAEMITDMQNKDIERFFDLANQMFLESTTLDGTYGNSWRRWAFSLYEQGKFFEAWAKVKQAQKTNARPFPPAFLRALNQALPEPK